MKRKIIMPVVLGALVLAGVAVFGAVNSTAGTVHAQTTNAANVKQVGSDKETSDDTISPKPAETVQEKTDVNEKDQPDSTNGGPEVEDGN